MLPIKGYFLLGGFLFDPQICRVKIVLWQQIYLSLRYYLRMLFQTGKIRQNKLLKEQRKSNVALTTWVVNSVQLFLNGILIVRKLFTSHNYISRASHEKIYFRSQRGSLFICYFLCFPPAGKNLFKVSKKVLEQ